MGKALKPEEAIASMKKFGFTPLVPYPGTDKPWLSNCEVCGTNVSPALSSVKTGHGCRKCAYLKNAKNATRSRSEANKILRAANLIPLVPYPGAGEPWLSKCKTCEQEVSPRLAAVIRGGGCKYCRYDTVSKKLSLSNTEILVTLKKAGVKPLETYPGDRKTPWKTECLSCGKELTIRISQLRVSKIKACRDCRSSDKYKIEDKVAQKEMISFGARPLEVYPGDSIKWKCECLRCGAEVTPTLSSARSGTNPCRDCTYPLNGLKTRDLRSTKEYKEIMFKRSLDKFKSQDEDAQKEMISFGAKPLEDYPGANKSWKCLCLKCNMEVYPRLSKVRGGTNPCRDCAYLSTGLRHRNNSEKCRLEMLNAGFITLVEYPGLNIPWLSKCQGCQKEVTPRLGTVRIGRGCINCTNYGFNPQDSAIVYLIQKGDILKIGIANTQSKRLADHSRHDWELHSLIECSNGRQAIFIETAILRWFRQELKAPIACTPKDMPQRGWTETITIEYTSPEEVWAKVQKLKKKSRHFQGLPSEKTRYSLKRV